MKAVNILEFLEALIICILTISSKIGLMLHFDIFTPSSICWPIIFQFAYMKVKLKGGPKIDEGVKISKSNI